MQLTFFKYFLAFIFKSKTRQKLLFIAIAGLMLSSFSLIVIQSIMGGLQNGLIQRSKNVFGVGQLEFKSGKGNYQEIYTKLLEQNIEFYPEYEIELLFKHANHISPVILHGLDFDHATPKFLSKKDNAGLILGSDLGSSLNAYFSTRIEVLSPAHLDHLFGAMPRSVSDSVSDFYMSELTEIDSIHAWTRLRLVQNLVRKRKINKIRFYNEKDFYHAQNIIKDGEFQTWEDTHESLVWALALETNVMLLLFVAMSFLVALCITSGFMIFFDKVKVDLLSFWVIGLSRKKVFQLTYLFTHFISFVFSFIGIALGLGFLYLLSSNQINFMPDFFVERSIPVKITTLGVVKAFFIPYLIATFFSRSSFKLFKKENESFLSQIRKII
jgi:lipoprotein-releasing system permease protein